MNKERKTTETKMEEKTKIKYGGTRKNVGVKKLEKRRSKKLKTESRKTKNKTEKHNNTKNRKMKTKKRKNKRVRNKGDEEKPGSKQKTKIRGSKKHLKKRKR